MTNFYNIFFNNIFFCIDHLVIDAEALVFYNKTSFNPRYKRFDSKIMFYHPYGLAMRDKRVMMLLIAH